MSSDFFDRCLASMSEPISLNPHTGGGFVYSNVNHSITYETDENMQCPKCGGEMTEKSGMYGKFFGCKDFPKCKGSRNIK